MITTDIDAMQGFVLALRNFNYWNNRKHTNAKCRKLFIQSRRDFNDSVDCLLINNAADSINEPIQQIIDLEKMFNN